MIGVLRVRPDFEHREYSFLEKNCLHLASEFEGQRSDFFYALYPDRIERYLIIRIDTEDKEKFVSRVQQLGSNLGFDILDRYESGRILKTNHIDTFR